MAVTLTKVHHVGMLVTDLDRTIAFYTKLFGTEPKTVTEVQNSADFDQQMEAQNGRARVAFFDVDNTSVEFIQVLNPQEPKQQPSPHTPGSKHLCFQVDDADEMYERMKAEGYDFIAPPAHFTEKQGPLNGFNWAYFRDPDGNIIEIMEDPTKKGLLSRLAS